MNRRSERLGYKVPRSAPPPQVQIGTRTTSSKKRQTPRPRTRRGALHNWLTEMPLDVLYETFSHLRPLDLLHLSRTTKSLRSALLSKHSISVWRAARIRNVADLPDCPPNMSEPLYASLLFESQCRFCEARNSGQMLWESKLRCCNRCLQDRDLFADEDELLFILPNEQFLAWEKIQGCLPSHYRRPALSADKTFVWPLAQSKAMINEFMSIECDSEKDKWIEVHVAAAADQRKHAEACREWTSSRSVQRDREIYALKRQRKQEIIRRLKEDEGLQDEIESWPEWGISFLGTSPHFRTPKTLTDRVWSNIREDVLRHTSSIQAMVDDEGRRLGRRSPFISEYDH